MTRETPVGAKKVWALVLSRLMARQIGSSARVRELVRRRANSQARRRSDPVKSRSSGAGSGVVAEAPAAKEPEEPLWNVNPSEPRPPAGKRLALEKS